MTKVYFNELSAHGSVDDADIKKSLKDLITCLQHLHQHNVDVVVVDGKIGQYMVSDRKSIYQILSDSSIFDNDRIVFFLSAFQEDYHLQEEIEDNDILSAKCKGFDAVGLTLASEYVNKGICLSLSQSGWDEPIYEVQLDVLNDQGEISTIHSKSLNASTEEELTKYDEYFPKEEILTPHTGKLLYLELGERFPNLVFSSAVENYIKRCHSKDEIKQIYERLLDLNNVALSLDGKPFSPQMFSSKASPESSTRDTMAELDVTFDDGIVRHCSWHLRYTPGAGRIHFCSDASGGKTIYVGYIGPKLNH